MMKKIICLLIVLTLSLTVTSVFASEDASGEDVIDYTTGIPWLCSNLDGNVTADTEVPELTEDFYLACNIEELQNFQIPESYGSYGTAEEVAIQLNDDIADLFTSNVEAKSHDAQLALNLYSLYMDWDSRNEVGVTPLKEMTDAVEAIDSIEALTDYLGSTPLEDQLSNLYTIGITVDKDDASSYILAIKCGELMLNDAAEYQELTLLGKVKKDAYEIFVSRVLEKLGYSEDEAAEKIENCLALEAQLARSMISEADKKKPDYQQKTNNHYTRQELVEAQGSVPLIATFEEAAGYPEADTYLLLEPDWLDKLNSLYTEENLDLIKDYLIVHGIIKNAASTDRECYDWSNEMSNEISGAGVPSDEIAFSSAVAQYLKWPVARLYTETYLNQDDKDRLSGLFDEIISEYHGIIEEADFLTDETKAEAIEKLEAIDKRILWPDDWSKYECEDLQIPSAADGGTLWEAKKAIKRYDIDQDIERYLKPVDKEKWSQTPNTFNCGYASKENAVYICGAYARGDIYNAEMSDEDLYARIGMVIGHEISHAFDSSGAQYDKDGNLEQWWTDEDWAAFQERNEKLSTYFDKFHPWEGQDFADNKTGEACADMGGIKCMLRLAAQKDGFDYDKFFRSFADMWLSKSTLIMVYISLDNEHPMNYLRVNCTLQQFDEFLDFYGIEEGDTMYLAPEDRVNIW